MAYSSELITKLGTSIFATDAWCAKEGAWQVELLAEKKMLQGKIFLAFQTISIAASGTAYAALETGDVPVMANIQSVTLVDGTLTIELFEGADLTTGTPVTINNMNRESSEASTVTLSVAPTVNTEGTKLDHLSLGSSGIGNTIVTSSLSARLAWRFKPNTKYLLKLTNNGASDINATFRATIVED